jgi:L-fuculose-phosphate aldolase
LDLHGNVLEGDAKPSSEIKMHLRVFNENPEVNAVTHAHPPIATAFSIAEIDLNKAIFAESIVMLGVIPVAKYATPGTQEVPDSIAPFCKDYNAVLLAHHGALTWGRNAMEAYFRMESLEHYALIYMYTENVLKNSKQLNCRQVTDLINIRERYGVKSGGVPIYSENEAEA